MLAITKSKISEKKKKKVMQSQHRYALVIVKLVTFDMIFFNMYRIISIHSTPEHIISGFHLVEKQNNKKNK